MINIIASVGKNNELGKNNKLIWKIPSDMKFFKDITMGHIVVMGRRTYESLPAKLTGRKMIVITSKKINDDVLLIDSVDKLLDLYLDSKEEVFVIGGSSIYEQFIEYATKIYLTEINAKCDDADAYFPYFKKSDWNKQILENSEYNGVEFKICEYIKK